MTTHVHTNHLHAFVRECWVLARNKRCSGDYPEWTTEPTIHAVAVESINVEEPHRRQGHCKAFLEALTLDSRFSLVVVEAVQNPILAEALLRWGWDVDTGVSDYYHKGGAPS